MQNLFFAKSKYAITSSTEIGILFCGFIGSAGLKTLAVDGSIGDISDKSLITISSAPSEIIVAALCALYGTSTENLSQYSRIIETNRHGTIVSPPELYKKRSIFCVFLMV